MRPVQSHEAFIGALVVWMHKPRGGYGYVIPVEAKIVALNLQGDRMVIEVPTANGSRVQRSVGVTALRWRERSPLTEPSVREMPRAKNP